MHAPQLQLSRRLLQALLVAARKRMRTSNLCLLVLLSEVRSKHMLLCAIVAAIISHDLSICMGRGTQASSKKLRLRYLRCVLSIGEMGNKGQCAGG